MAIPKKPLNCIAAVIKTSYPMSSVPSFLGTAFFIDGVGTFLTACHVIDDPLSAGQTYAIAFASTPGGKSEIYRVTDLRYSRRYDIAMGRAVGVSPKEHLTLADHDPKMNHAILTIEFSYSMTRRTPEDEPYLELEPAFHMGYIRAKRPSRLRGLEGARILELPFPALKGASGAPIIVAEIGVAQSGDVVGMILRNLETELLPAHIEVIEGESGEPTETHKYFLPSAYAISWQHLSEFVKTQQDQEEIPSA